MNYNLLLSFHHEKEEGRNGQTIGTHCFAQRAHWMTSSPLCCSRTPGWKVTGKNSEGTWIREELIEPSPVLYSGAVTQSNPFFPPHLNNLNAHIPTATIHQVKIHVWVVHAEPYLISFQPHGEEHTEVDACLGDIVMYLFHYMVCLVTI